jgi:hypothetical protein
MTILRLLACGSVLFAVGCSSGSGGNAGGGSDGGGSDGTTDGIQSGSEGGPDAAGDSGGGTGDAPSDTGSGGDSMGTPDSPYDAGPPGDATSCGVNGNAVCNGYCVDTYDDIHNCGGCGIDCPGPNPYCDNGHCTTPPCDGGACGNSTFCCGGECCTAGQLCCDVPSNIPSFPKCTAPVNGTCPAGCLGCP